MIKKAVHFFLGTLLSRFGGMIREQVMSYAFGATAFVSEFTISYRFVNIFRRVLGEGGVSQGFIPYYEKISLESKKESDCFFRDLFWTLLLLVIPIILIAEFFFFHTMTGALFFGLIFIVFYALCMGFLQCHGVYFLPSSAPIVFNLVWIISCFLTKEQQQSRALLWLCYSISFAFFIQWIILIPSVIKRITLSWKEWLTIHPFSPSVKEMILPLILGLLGVGASQINGFFDALIVNEVSFSAPAYLNYALKLEQAPMALFGIAIASAAAPELSRAFQSNQMGLFISLAQRSFRLTLKLLLPFTLFMLTLAGPLVNLVFGRGAFLEQDVIETAKILIGYTLGLVPAGLVLLLAPSFYAKRDFKTPLYGTLISVGINLSLSCLFTKVLSIGAISVAFATTIAAWAQLIFLLSRLHLSIEWNLLSETLIKCALFFLLLHWLAPTIFIVDRSYPRILIDQIFEFLLASLIPFVIFGLIELFFFRFFNSGKQVERKKNEMKNFPK